MTEFEWMQKVRVGEKDAFEKWMDIYSGDIERFAIQYGCVSKQAADVAEETFRDLHNQLDSIGNEESLVCALYKNALKSLASAQQTDPQNETLFPFKEDQELHDKIVNLETEHKVPFILSQFHMLDDSEIAVIMDISLEEVQQAITAVSGQLEDPQLEKRLEFLNKSYGRMKSSFRKEQVFAKPQKEIRTTEKLKQTISKKAMISWIAGILVLLVLVAVPVVTGEEYKKASAEKYIERLKESFEKEIGNRYTELGLPEPTEEDKQEFYYIGYGQQAREDFEMMIQREERGIAETGKIDKKNIGKQYDEIIKTLVLPSELAKQLVKNPLTSDKEESREFINEYVKQIYEIQQAYSAFLYKYHQFIEDATVGETVSIEKYLEKKGSYPEELQQALNSMEKQNFYLIPFYPIYAKNELSAQLKASIHKDFRGYIAFLESSLINYYSKPASSYNELIDTLVEIENTLLANAEIEIPNTTLEDHYSWLVYLMVTGSETNQIVGSDGKVTEEVKSIWEKIASNGEESPSAFIMQKVINEMEASGWTESETQSHLNLYHLAYAMGLAREGRLHTFEMSGILQSDRGLSSVTFPDSSFEDLVEKTYELYSKSHDPAVLKDVHPLVIFAVYYFANDHEDPEMMWHLYNPEDDLHTLEEYISGWRKVDVNLYEVKSLLFDGRESSAGSVGFVRGNMTYFYADMILDEAVGWKINNVDLNSMRFE